MALSTAPGSQPPFEARAILPGKRILIVFESLELGGAERQGIHLARHLTEEQGCHVQVWAFRGPGRAAAICEEYSIPWHVVPVRWSWNRRHLLTNLARWTFAVRRFRPDALLPYTILPNKVCGLTWRGTGARTCVWNQRDEGRGAEGGRIERAATRWTPLFVSNSQHGARFLTEALGVPISKTRVVHNGVLLAPARLSSGEWRIQLGVTSHTFLATMVANLHSHKDHETLLHAWRKVVSSAADTGRKAVLLLAGRFDDTHVSLKALAYDLELGRSVRFLGPVDDVSGLLSATHLAVFSSRCEGCPNGVLEAMASGLPVVATDIPGIRDAVGPDGYPCLVPPGGVDVLAERILRLAGDEMLRARLGEANRRRVETEFNLTHSCQQMVELLATALSGARSTPRNSHDADGA